LLVWDGHVLRDPEGEPVLAMYKLLPYEWMRGHLLEAISSSNPPLVFEPPWRAILSNKKSIAVAWSMFPGHRALIETVTSEVGTSGDWVLKPALGRAGAGVTYLRNGAPAQLMLPGVATQSEWSTDEDGTSLSSSSSTSDEATLAFDAPSDSESETEPDLGDLVAQKYVGTATAAGRPFILGGWVVGGKPVALTVREDPSGTTQGDSAYVPHVVGGDPAMYGNRILKCLHGVINGDGTACSDGEAPVSEGEGGEGGGEGGGDEGDDKKKKKKTKEKKTKEKKTKPDKPQKTKSPKNTKPQKKNIKTQKKSSKAPKKRGGSKGGRRSGPSKG
jgi:hypothetical protein